MDRPDGRPGPSLRTSPRDCGAVAAAQAAGRPPPATSGVEPTDAPSIFTALREQLGLRLDPGQAPVQGLTIERIERPSVD